MLASGSPRRVALLEQIGLKPDALLPVDLDESPRMGEKGLPLAKRLAREKAEAAALKAKDISALAGSFILAADTVVWAVGRVLPKPEQELEAAWCLRKLSGRSHRVFTGIALVTPDGKLREKLVETRVRIQDPFEEEVAAYIASGEWRGKAGGYAIQGLAAAFCQRIIGVLSQRRRPASRGNSRPSQWRRFSGPLALAVRAMINVRAHRLRRFAVPRL